MSKQSFSTSFKYTPPVARRLESCVDPSQAVEAAENSDDVGDGGSSGATSTSGEEEEEEVPPHATTAAAAAAAGAALGPKDALRGGAGIDVFPDSMDPFPAWQRRRSRSMASLLQEGEGGLRVADDGRGCKELSRRGGAAGSVEGQMQQQGKASGGQDGGAAPDGSPYRQMQKQGKASGGAAHSGSPYRLRNSEEMPKVRKRELFSCVRRV